MKPLLRRLLIWVALPVLLVSLAVWSWTPREPSWDGRSLREWLKDLEPARTRNPSAVDEQNAAAARRAIQGMGTNCLPFLLRRIERIEPAPLEKMLIQLEEQLADQGVKVPWTRTQTRLELEVYDACDAVKALGNQAVAAVPEFKRWLLSSSDVKVSMGAYLLSEMAPEGIAVLIAASTNRTMLNRAAVAVRLHSIASEHPQAFTALLGMTADADPGVRGHAGYLITSSHYEAAVIWPVINRLLADVESSVRRVILGKLERFRGDLRPAEPALRALLTDPDPETRSQAKALLDKIKAASPTPPPAPPAPPP